MGKTLTEEIRAGVYDAKFRILYGTDEKVLAFQRERYIDCIQGFYETFGETPEGDAALRLLSVPGRSEVGGNHTDHNHGRVLACAVDLDIIAVVRPAGDGIARVKSKGFPVDTVALSELVPEPAEKYRSQALVRGVCARLKEQGYAIGEGFEAFTTSNVLKGSGLSSSAAYEVMIANIVSQLYNGGDIDPVVMAQAAQYAESIFFGKPCGLMDQTACAVGGFITIDFADPAKPVIEKLGFDFAKTGFTLCIVDTAGNHSNLNEDYASIQAEMKAVAAQLGKTVLRECDEAAFYTRIADIRAKTGDRAVLRAIHFFGDNARVAKQTQALRAGNFETFKKLVIESGHSSYMYLQNVFSTQDPSQQGLSLALALSERLLAGSGAWRVHGGGFAGTIQAFVPADRVEAFVAEMNGVFGEKASYRLRVRPLGACAVR